MFNDLRKFLSDYNDIDPQKIQMNSSFVKDLGLTSYDIIEMCAQLEEHYNIEIEEEELTKLNIVGDLVNYLQNKINN